MSLMIILMLDVKRIKVQVNDNNDNIRNTDLYVKDKNEHTIGYRNNLPKNVVGNKTSTLKS